MKQQPHLDYILQHMTMDDWRMFRCRSVQLCNHADDRFSKWHVVHGDPVGLTTTVCVGEERKEADSSQNVNQDDV